MICGVDEAGRGPLAGPVVAAAVILCEGGIEGLDDSKKLSAAKRAALEPVIRERCTVGIGIADVHEIDGLNILRAACHWARDRGAGTLALVCTRENHAANATYRAAGMTHLGGYHYRRKDEA